MRKFKGFAPGRQKTIPLMVQFFTDLLPLIDDVAELKVILFCFQALHQKEGPYRFLRLRDFQDNSVLMDGLAQPDTALDGEKILKAALAKAVKQGALLAADVLLENGAETLYFMNTARGRNAVEQIRGGKWRPDRNTLGIEILPERPNVFALYEANVGLLTPLIADAIKDAEDDYPTLWIEDAIKLAVEQNKRSWSYIRAILERWKQEGRNSHETAQRHRGENYLPGQYDEFLKS